MNNYGLPDTKLLQVGPSVWQIPCGFGDRKPQVEARPLEQEARRTHKSKFQALEN